MSLFFTASQIKVLERLTRSDMTVNDLTFESISGFEDGFEA